MIGDGRAARAFVISRRNDPFKGSGCPALVSRFGVQAEEGLPQIETLCRAVDDLPIMEIAAPAERNDARADAADWQPDLSQVILIVADS